LLQYQEWGEGDPLLALHPLALESTAFAGVSGALRGLRTLAVDLPGFGRTPALDGALTPSRLAEPVVELARSLERPPLLLGMSLGGRVALEAALVEPDSFRGLVLVAPYLPSRRWRPFYELARMLDPRWDERIPLEKAWPILKRVAEAIEGLPDLEHDWLARASARVVYYSSCPATRVAFLSAARELALDPPNGRRGLWARLASLRLPATFLWAGRDALVPARHAGEVAAVLPRADQLEVPCAGHFVHGSHFRCMRHAIALAVEHTLEVEGTRQRLLLERGTRSLAPCLAGMRHLEDPVAAASSSSARTASG
jgi:pimeloyl-ACP methyl ester carboxylesterase